MIKHLWPTAAWERRVVFHLQFRQQSLTKGRRVCLELKARTWSRTWCRGHGSSGLLSLFSYTPRALPSMFWALLQQSLVKKMPYSLPLGIFYGGIFSIDWLVSSCHKLACTTSVLETTSTSYHPPPKDFNFNIRVLALKICLCLLTTVLSGGKCLFV